VLLVHSFVAQENKNHQSFYFGIAGISSFTSSTLEDSEITSVKPLNFGAHIGNTFRIKKRFVLDLECFYLNNKVEIGRKDHFRFELHQNLGFNIKPGIRFNKHSFYVQLGMAAVYVFDKNENTENNVIDRFDQSIFYGLSYDFRIHQYISFQLGYLHSKFNAISHWTDYELHNFSVLSLGALFHLE
tara:strand:- start:940 stop:1497 length:558 start_codon:yes stop_codon:yes gene_type:complete